MIANGGMAGLLMILYMFFELPEIYLFYLAALAAATADTWATEIGTLARQQPRLITSFKNVAAGTSGGITAVGLLSASLGALTIGNSGWLFFLSDFDVLSVFLIILYHIGWRFGSLVDSLLGAPLQIQYRLRNVTRLREQPEPL